MSNSPSHLDYDLLLRCVQLRTRAWEDFVDRFLGLVLHVIDYTTVKRNVQLCPEERTVLCERVFAALGHDQFRLLRNFKQRSNLTTYLSVTVRRIVIRLLLNQNIGTEQPAFHYNPVERMQHGK